MNNSENHHHHSNGDWHFYGGCDLFWNSNIHIFRCLYRFFNWKMSHQPIVNNIANNVYYTHTHTQTFENQIQFKTLCGNYCVSRLSYIAGVVHIVNVYFTTSGSEYSESRESEVSVDSFMFAKRTMVFSRVLLCKRFVLWPCFLWL